MHLYVSLASDRMDRDDLRDVDRGILDELANDRANAPFLAEELGYSKQYIRERLGILKDNDFVVSVGHGLYTVKDNS